MAPPDAAADLEQSFAGLASALLEHPTTTERTFQRIAVVAVEAISGCDAAGVLVAGGPDGWTTVTATAPVVVRLHELQVRGGRGPCLDAAGGGSSCGSGDLADDRQWPAFSRAAVRLGVRSALAHPLGSTGVAALDLYGATPAAFGVDDRARALVLALLGGAALAGADARAEQERQAANLREALETRELIGQAQGILMERERITADEAFSLLRDSSQHLNVKLRDVARDLVETGERPKLRRRPSDPR